MARGFARILAGLGWFRLASVAGLIVGMAFLAGVASPVAAGGPAAEIGGTVHNRTTGQPGAGITVVINQARVQTDERGVFTLADVPPGVYTVGLVLPGGYTPALPPQELTIAGPGRYTLALDFYAGPAPETPAVTYPSVPTPTVPLPAPPVTASASEISPIRAALPLTASTMLTATQAASSPALCAETYLTRPGDTLTNLARQYYGKRQAYTLILEGTSIARKLDPSFGLITNPGTLPPGLKLCLPGLSPGQAAEFRPLGQVAR